MRPSEKSLRFNLSTIKTIAFLGLFLAVVFGAFAKLPSSGSPYVLFALSGMVIFGLFSNAVTRAGSAFIRDGQLVAKVYFPRALLPLGSGAASIVDFGVGFAALLAIMLATGYAPPLAIIIAPIVALAALCLGLAVGLAVSALSAHYRDFAIAVPFALQVLLYASPVVYSAELIPAGLQPLYNLNPLVAITEAFRASVLGTEMPSGPDAAISGAIGLLIIVISVVVFARVSRDLTDII